MSPDTRTIARCGILVAACESQSAARSNRNFLVRSPHDNGVTRDEALQSHDDLAHRIA